MEIVKPFVKWAGGKGSLISQLTNFYPFELKDGIINKYVEPFVGGGAVYLNINCENSVINDKSDELMLLYKMIKKHDKGFIDSLNQINKNWISLQHLVEDNTNELSDIYDKVKSNKNSADELVEKFVEKHTKELNSLLEEDFDINLYNFFNFLSINFSTFSLSRSLISSTILEVFSTLLWGL